MYVSAQDRTYDPLSIADAGSSFDGSAGDVTGETQSLLGGPAADNVSRMLPPPNNNTNGDGTLDDFDSGSQALTSPISSLISGIGSLLSQLGNYLGIGSNGNGVSSGGYGPAGGNEHYFQSASASSTGDPHLAFDGTAANGSTTNAKWDNMSSHGDLLDSDSFKGGYRISTQATQPNANGITYNNNATVTTDGGATSVTLGANGNATIVQNGQTSSLADGQQLDLGNEESVSRNADGSVVVSDRDRSGGSITTTLSENGSGVDVNVSAQDVALGGYLANANGTAAQTSSVTPANGTATNAAQQRNGNARRYALDDALAGTAEAE